MKIKHIHIKNFKSIKNLEIDLTDINAFIGANNAGKSNIFSAINFLLGRNYPMPANITKEQKKSITMEILKIKFILK